MEHKVAAPKRLYSELILARRHLINIHEVYEKVRAGTKMILLTDEGLEWPDASTGNMAWDSMMFQVHADPAFSFADAPVVCPNGREFEEMEGRVKEYFPTFNAEQYRVEHADRERHIQIAAGAGSGKTTVMVQRILYLMKHAGVAPEEIAMITFTREAAKNMFEKLSEALFIRYKMTGRPEYLEDIEKLNSIQISTIDSFLYKLIRQLGAEIGLSHHVRIRGYKRERYELIEKAVDSYISAYTEKHPDDRFFDSLFASMRDYELIQMIDQFWEEFEKKGIRISSKGALDSLFGEANRLYQPMQELIAEVIYWCDQQLALEQLDEDAVSLGYLSRMLNHLLEDRPGALQKIWLPYHYLFIDEFQDSSDFQIRLAQQLAQQRSMQLFVVGDIKQSIYRFRGADESAFKKLQEFESREAASSWLHFSLTKNYRSSKDLLHVLDRKYFSSWGRNFPYGEHDRLTALRPKEEGAASLLVQPLAYEEKKECRSTVISWIHKAVRQVQGKDPKKHRIAVLTRTRKEARLVASWCAQEDIPFHLDIGGTLFESEAARDVNRLLHALLFPNDTQHFCDYFTTPYSRHQLDPSFLLSADGSPDAIKKRLQPFLSELQEHQKNVRLLPILSLLRQIIRKSEPVDRYYRLQREKGAAEEEAARRALAYELNLGKLMDMMIEKHSGDYVSLASLLSWFKIQVKTNRDEDEAHAEELTRQAVNILTVHRAKGLEYHSVILPFTDRYFYTSLLQSGLVFDEQKSRAGWKVVFKGSGQNGAEDAGFSSGQFDLLKHGEEEAIEAEELRLLYVAMTRAQEQLWVIKCTYKPHKPCWAKYLPVHSGAGSEVLV